MNEVLQFATEFELALRSRITKIPQIPHDSWVVGNEPYVSLHSLGADHAKSPPH